MSNPLQEKPNLFRKYFYEYAIFGLTSCVVYLFFAFRDLNKYIIDTSVTQRIEQAKVIEQNTQVIREFLNFQKQNK